ncbi:MAG: MgtC/SapB family protein [Egibacteraceae bacterium]
MGRRHRLRAHRRARRADGWTSTRGRGCCWPRRCATVGLERELRGKAAGLRTHVVVGVASAALGAVSLLAAPEGSAVADQTRIAAQVVSGTGLSAPAWSSPRAVGSMG